MKHPYQTTITALAIAFSGFFTLPTLANELDNEEKVTNYMNRAKDLPATIVIRVNEKTGVAEMATVKSALAAEDLNESAVEKLAFTKIVAGEKVVATEINELDQDKGRESWYFYVGYNPWYGYGSGYGYGYGYGYSYYPTYYYGGYSYGYYPYYNYGGCCGYSYSYYRPAYGYGYGRPGWGW